jgi:hypothetical protein
MTLHQEAAMDGSQSTNQNRVRVIDGIALLSAIGAFLAALFAGIAAWETHQGVLETAKATRAGVVLQVLAEYETPAMFDAMNNLRSWRQQHPQQPERAFKELLLKATPADTGGERLKEVVASLRRLSNFFARVKMMYDLGYIDQQFVPWPCANYRDLLQIHAMERARVEAMVQENLYSQSDRTDAEHEATQQLAFYRRLLCPGDGGLTPGPLSPSPQPAHAAGHGP